MKEQVVERFLRYINVHTTSDPENMVTPSATRILDLADILKNELIDLGMSDVTLDEYGYVMAKLPSNSTKNIPAIGFLAHMDTSPDYSGENVKPQIIEAYDGGSIALGDTKILSPENFPSLKKYIGETLITTDGTTLLGADDKAGIAEIMTAMEYLIAHPEIEHGTICVAFNPDEEVGRGVVKFDVDKFGADFSYTLDGGKVGELQYENFNAASMDVLVQGRAVHPGEAKNTMINAQEIALAFHAALPTYERPQFTTGYEGFYHLHEMSGDVENAKLHYIIRDHGDELFAKKKDYAQQVVAELQVQYPDAVITVNIEDSYLNMKRQIMPVFEIIELAEAAMQNCGITPIIEPIRGGTDGSNLSYMDLPCPNIFAGGHNFHGPFEYIPTSSMLKATEVVIEIVKLAASK